MTHYELLCSIQKHMLRATRKETTPPESSGITSGTANPPSHEGNTSESPTEMIHTRTPDQNDKFRFSLLTIKAPDDQVTFAIWATEKVFNEGGRGVRLVRKFRFFHLVINHLRQLDLAERPLSVEELFDRILVFDPSGRVSEEVRREYQVTTGLEYEEWIATLPKVAEAKEKLSDASAYNTPQPSPDPLVGTNTGLEDASEAGTGSLEEQSAENPVEDDGRSKKDTNISMNLAPMQFTVLSSDNPNDSESTRVIKMRRVLSEASQIGGYLIVQVGQLHRTRPVSHSWLVDTGAMISQHHNGPILDQVYIHTFSRFTRF